MIEAWASQRSFQPKDNDREGDGRNFRGQRRTNETHASKTDPDAKLYRKSFNTEARLAYLGHILMEHRHGLVVQAMATEADGMAERDAAMLMMDIHAGVDDTRRRTIGADQHFDTHRFVETSRELGFTPQVSQNLNRRGGSALDARTTRHQGYALSQACRPRIERIFGWLTTTAGLRRIKLRGLEKARRALRLRLRRLQLETPHAAAARGHGLGPTCRRTGGPAAPQRSASGS